MDVSNKTLVFFLVLTIVVSTFGALVSINKLTQIQSSIGATGLATGNLSDTGTATLSITTTAMLIFYDDVIDWGSGYVNTTAGNTHCNLTSEDTNDGTQYCVGFDAQADGLTLRNEGSTVFTTTWINSSATPTDLLAGTDPNVWIKASEEGNACLGNLNFSEYTAIDAKYVDYPGEILCTTGYNYTVGADDIDLDVKVSIPYNSKTGAITNTFTAIGEY